MILEILSEGSAEECEWNIPARRPVAPYSCADI
jgi:hypothetical protein